MADSSSRNNSLRIPRLRGSGNASRNGSVRRSSALIDEHRQSSGAFHSLRSTGSRYSLNEQFAATRREYEFGDDDASSIYERMTVASDVGEVNGDRALLFDDLVIPEEGPECAEDADVSDPSQADFYEVLCLPRGAELSQEQIREAYYRLLLLLYPDSFPDHLQPFIQRRFQRVQEAFETLVDPHRRAVYDAALLSDIAGSDLSEIHGDTYKETLSSCARNAVSPDLSVQLGGALSSTPGADPSTQKMRPALGFTLGHTVQVGLPAINGFMRQSIAKAAAAITSKHGDAEKLASGLKVGIPTLSVRGAVHGLFTDTFPPPVVLLAGRSSTPPDTSTLGRSAGPLPAKKLSRLFSLDCAEEVWKSPHDPSVKGADWQDASGISTPNVLPAGTLTAQLSQTIEFPGAAGPTTLDATIGSPALGAGYALPRVSVGVTHKLSNSTAFIRGDSGQWSCSADSKALLSGDISRIGRGLLSAVPASARPSVEVGFSTDPVFVGGFLPATEDRTRLHGATPSSSGGDWTVSATTTGATTAGYVRYGKDLRFRRPQRGTWQRPSRLEVEACTGALGGTYVALRNLVPFGRFSTAGLELSISRHSFHLSIHWSRLNQRISLPVLLCPQAFSSPSLIFWAGAVPMLGLAAVELLRQCWRPSGRPLPDIPLQPTAQASIARRRIEADNLTTLLSGPIDARQKRQASLGNLVILNAKYGVRDDDGSWAAEEVADVTVALAALVGQDGRLVIPRGIRKANLLGFWDPAPDSEKVLLVRYSWRGKETVAEVKGSDELCLPAVDDIDLN